MDTAFCLEALNEAVQTYGAPEIFNTDQGSQFTSEEFTGVLKSSNIKISMDGKGRWIDNVFIERLWRSLKYEEVYLKAYETVTEARSSIKGWIRFYNHERTHQSLGRQTPGHVYFYQSLAGKHRDMYISISPWQANTGTCIFQSVNNGVGCLMNNPAGLHLRIGKGCPNYGVHFISL